MGHECCSTSCLSAGCKQHCKLVDKPSTVCDACLVGRCLVSMPCCVIDCAGSSCSQQGGGYRSSIGSSRHSSGAGQAICGPAAAGVNADRSPRLPCAASWGCRLWNMLARRDVASRVSAVYCISSTASHHLQECQLASTARHCYAAPGCECKQCRTGGALLQECLVLDFD